jgi:hypothetical protein
VTPVAVLALALGLLLLVGIVITTVLLPALRRMADGADAWSAEFAADAATAGETIVAGPEPASYRGGTGGHSRVKGNGTIVLTDRRLVFRKLTGEVTDVERSTVTGTREEQAFLGARVGGQTCLVVETDEPAEVGFFVTDLAAWRDHLETGR